MISALKHALSARQRRSSRIFIAWSHETKPAADAIRAYLRDQGFSPWLSDDIGVGRRFREEIGNKIRHADLVIAVFPPNPSHWLVAEAGLAYFEQKLIPVAVDGDFTTEPFGDLQILKFSRSDFSSRSLKTLAPLLQTVEERLGSGTKSLIPYVFRLLNLMFFSGTPLLGITLVGSLLWLSLAELEDPYNSLQLWKAGHIILGATVYGGSAFVALLFARAGVSNSFMERQFGISTAQRLFGIWFSVALAQMLAGFYLVYLSDSYKLSDGWIIGSVIAYFLSLMCFLFGFICYRSSNNADKEGMERTVLDSNVFAANAFFGVGLILLTAVIVLMGLKAEATDLLM